MKRCLMIAMMLTGAAICAQADGTNEPPKAAAPAQTTDERIASMEKALLKKLNAIEDRLDKMEKDRATQKNADDRKFDQLARDVEDIRRDTQRMDARR